jgi:hypothetical protein
MLSATIILALLVTLVATDDVMPDGSQSSD